MRISDWSSDVCSSDLVQTVPVAAIITNYLQNAARQTIDGVDLAVTYDFDISARDRLHLNGSASYLKIDQQLTASQPVLPFPGLLFRQPHWRAQSSATWARLHKRREGKACVRTCKL